MGHPMAETAKAISAGKGLVRNVTAQGRERPRLTLVRKVEVDRSRDQLLTEFGKTTLQDRYLLAGESYQDMFARVATAYADDADHAQRVYDYISNLWFMPATPVLSNGGANRGLPISCFLNAVPDSLDGIVGVWNENVALASNGGGIGTYWGGVRSIGEKVKGAGQTSGIIPFIRVMDSLTLAISQGSLRRGSAAVYLDVHHPEIEEFLEIRKPSGDFNRKSLNLHHGINITDAFMEAVRDGTKFALRSPKNEEVVREVDARSLWQKILEIRLQTGEPYLIFADTVNRAMPAHQQALGLKVRQSNLCSEIVLHTGRDHLGMDRTAVCCLSSVNAEKFLEWRDHPTFIEDVMRFLDNVLQDFIDSAPEAMASAVYAAERERSVGLGLMGFHSFLQAQGVPFESAMAKSWNMRIFKTLRRHRRAGDHGAVQPQAGHRADRLDLDHLRRHVGGHRARSGQHLHPQDPVGLVCGEEPLPGGPARREGAQHRGGLGLDPGERGLGPAPGLPEPGREGRLQDRLRAGPALGGRTRRRPHAVHLPEPIGQPVPPRRRA
jgi:ribonucleoside-diphosphate reductase alpha chain